MVVDQLSSSEIDRIFQALADATRRDILRRVMTRERSVSDLAAAYAMSFAAVQKHVAVLERALLVEKHRHGREQIVHGAPAAIRRAAGLLDDYESIWNDRAERMSRILAEN